MIRITRFPPIVPSHTFADQSSRLRLSLPSHPVSRASRQQGNKLSFPLRPRLTSRPPELECLSRPHKKHSLLRAEQWTHNMALCMRTRSPGKCNCASVASQPACLTSRTSNMVHMVEATSSKYSSKQEAQPSRSLSASRSQRKSQG